ncbi:hypothetical protein P3L10_009830 [Capsicum annuum]
MASTTSIIKGGFSCGNTLSSFRARPRRMVVRAEAVNPDIRKDEEKVVNSLNLLLLTAGVGGLGLFLYVTEAT